VREGNPLAAWLLTVHPLAFAAAVPYLLVVLGTVLVLSRRQAAPAVGVTSAHAFAVGGWCLVLLMR
jgi:hypothetical protein